MWAAFDFSTMFVVLLMVVAFHCAAIWRAKCCFRASQVVSVRLRQSRSARPSIGGGCSALALDSGGF